MKGVKRAHPPLGPAHPLVIGLGSDLLGQQCDARHHGPALVEICKLILLHETITLKELHAQHTGSERDRPEGQTGGARI